MQRLRVLRKAAALDELDLRIETSDAPPRGPDEVLIAIRAAGVNRNVIGSRHSTRPATAGAIVKIRLGSTLASSDPATGRSNVTETTAVAAARSLGVTRRTRSGVAEDTARLPMASVTTAESARIRPSG